MPFVEIQAKYTGTHDMKMKCVEFCKLDTTKLNVKLWICEVTKPKLKPKSLPSHKAEAEAKALSFWNYMYKAEAEAEAKAEAASYLSLLLMGRIDHNRSFSDGQSC